MIPVELFFGLLGELLLLLMLCDAFYDNRHARELRGLKGSVRGRDPGVCIYCQTKRKNSSSSVLSDQNCIMLRVLPSFHAASQHHDYIIFPQLGHVRLMADISDKSS